MKALAKRGVAALCAAALTLFTFYIPLAMADTVMSAAPPVVLPWGMWVATALVASSSIVALVLMAFATKYIPPAYRAYITPQLIDEAVQFAIATVAGAVRYQVWDIPTTNSVIAQAEAFLIAHEGDIATALGDMLRPKIVAAVGKIGAVPAHADAADLDVTLPTPKAA